MKLRSKRRVFLSINYQSLIANTIYSVSIYNIHSKYKIKLVHTLVFKYYEFFKNNKLSM